MSSAGGIYTKAADMGADLVGKTEAHIPEDDPRNPATIADNVGDNVGDVAGLGSDLLESYVSAILSSAILAAELFCKNVFADSELLRGMLYFPVVFAGGGIIACAIGIASLLVRKKLSSDPHRELNLATWISAALSILCAVGFSYLFFGKYSGVASGVAGLSVFDTVEFTEDRQRHRVVDLFRACERSCHRNGEARRKAEQDGIYEEGTSRHPLGGDMQDQLQIEEHRREEDELQPVVEPDDLRVPVGGASSRVALFFCVPVG